MNIILRLLINVLVIVIVAYIVPGIDVSGFGGALIVAIVLAVINVTLKPLLILLTLPINVLTLGLFTFVINAFLLWFTGAILENFEVDGFMPALAGAVLISLFHFVVHRLEKSPVSV